MLVLPVLALTFVRAIVGLPKTKLFRIYRGTQADGQAGRQVGLGKELEAPACIEHSAEISLASLTWYRSLAQHRNDGTALAPHP